MEIGSSLATLSNKIQQLGNLIETEEATKNAFVMPFLNNVLGYDVFNPSEVIPEFTADTGTKKGEKVDYALLKDGAIQILIECKKYNEPLSLKHASQLYRYFSVTNARIAILTNGVIYQFFTDLDAPNKMDEKPFLELDLSNIDEHVIPEVAKLTKADFDVDSVINAAGELKYLNQIKKVIGQQVAEPEDDFVRFFASRVYDGVITQKVREQFAELTTKALRQFLNDKINDRLKSALANGSETPRRHDTEDAQHSELDDPDGNKVVTTVEELEGYHIVRAILREVVEVDRIAARDTQSYFGVLLDDNNRKPLCRLHFNRTQKYLGLFDEDKKETRHPIERLDDIFGFAAQLKDTAGFYD
ncbi:type I restriction endonuclease [Marinobacterium rhizophilum]|uniref:Type I restriction enzyme HsdR N-terminal domain-containing protein n=1 Tax=Marinobacterium rhizophilum TaxID=420402 RepID=A0ABY5HKG5_9GAMM|nr:type I restriction endonuclease [Marinobacterium rhizophilum]UTW12885.1 type I restriction enzyme HsdR N-terminal domain-containing protein [Marinobacterium rhizophilum]